MEFRSKINIPPSNISISHKEHLLAFGSCFSENIGRLLSENKFDINSNPFGILYNPKSISQAINRIIKGKTFTKDEIIYHNGLYHSFWHHGDFSSTDKQVCIDNINSSLVTAFESIKRVNVLIITFGTAYVFQAKDLNMVVGNCHKLPASSFNRYRLDIHSIVEDWNILISRLREINPNLKIIFTVSPIRHLKDGAHDNQLSKSILLLAIDQLIRDNEETSYFPSYEIVLDELRDYRFYNEDMTHPTPFAVKYIWQRFTETFFNEDTAQIIKEWAKINNALNHRAINADSAEHKDFLKQTLLKLQAFNKKYPYICCKKEITKLEEILS